MGIFAAVTRQTLDGAHPDGWIPEQKVSVSEAIHAYTVASAYASGEDQIKGSVEPGKLADLVILSADILAAAPENIQHTHVDATIFDGKVIYDPSLY
jgi:predicted amidohydrolase YtcJ